MSASKLVAHFTDVFTGNAMSYEVFTVTLLHPNAVAQSTLAGFGQDAVSTASRGHRAAERNNGRGPASSALLG